MSKLIIEGPSRLYGEIEVEGSKNAALPILTASILAENPVVIKNVPDIADVHWTIEILNFLGCNAIFDKNTVYVNPQNLTKWTIPQEYAKKMRSSILFLGALLSKFKKVKLTNHPGGCEIGQRPIDLHISAFKLLGINTLEYDNTIECWCDKIKGGEVFLQIPSVGATENIILTSIFCEDEVIIKNAAREPEIVDLCHFLNKLGAKIKGSGTHTIKIKGVKALKNNIEHSIIPDRIVAGTYLCAVATSGGEVIVRSVIPKHLDSILYILKSSGCVVKEDKDRVYIRKDARLRALSKITTHYYPGFPTDLQAQVCSTFSLAQGITIIKETIFENRFKHVGELIKMGANIVVEKDVAIINGVESLKGCEVAAMDLRGGAALLIAGIAAQGQTQICGLEHIDRGYERIEEKYLSLGAKVMRV